MPGDCVVTRLLSEHHGEGGEGGEGDVISPRSRAQLAVPHISHHRYRIFSPTQSQPSGQLSASTDIQSVITDLIKTNGSNKIVNQS